MAKLGKTLSKSEKHTSEEKLLYYYYKVTEYIENNKNRFYTFLTILVVIIAVIFIYFRSQSNKSESASLELSKVKQIYEMEMYQQAINGDSLGNSKGLLYIVNNFGSTESGETAKIMLANAYYYLRDFENAEKYYKDYSGNNNIFESASIAGIAAVYEAKGEYLNAAKNYEKASNNSKLVPNNDEYLFYAIRNYFTANDTDNLIRTIKLMKKEYPKSKYIGMLMRYEPIDTL